jgi:hypothetical protein
MKNGGLPSILKKEEMVITIAKKSYLAEARSAF